MGVIPFLKASLKNLLWLVPRVVAEISGSFHVVGLAVPVCTYDLLAMVSPVAMDLAVVWLS